jgi:hypothetical protein
MRIPRISSLDDLLLHDWVQVLQPGRAAECLPTHFVVGYYGTAQLDRVGEGVESGRKGKLVLSYQTIAVCVCKFSMHTGVRPQAVCKQLRVQLHRMGDYVVDATRGVV